MKFCKMPVLIRMTMISEKCGMEVFKDEIMGDNHVSMKYYKSRKCCYLFISHTRIQNS